MPIEIPGDSVFHAGTTFHREVVLSIGHRSYVGKETDIHVTVGITIGDDVMIAAGCLLMDTDMHSLVAEERMDDVRLTREKKTGEKDWAHVRCAPITIGDKAWIGARCILCAGTTIGEGAVIGAGSVVRGYVPPYTLYAGNPAVMIRSLK